MTVVGDRNEYHCLNVPLVPDWPLAWQTLFDVDLLAWDLYWHELDEGETGTHVPTPYHATGAHNLSGYLRAAARARRITVGEYAALRASRPAYDPAAPTVPLSFADTRWYGGRSRMTMPAALYLQQILFRAYRIPSAAEAGAEAAKVRLTNRQGVTVELKNLEISDRACWDTDFNPASGVMVAGDGTGEPGNGLAVVQNYQILSNIFAGLRWDTAETANWANATDMWGEARFNVEPAGDGTQVIVFEEPLVRLSSIVAPNGQGYPVPSGWDPLNAASYSMVGRLTARVGLTFLGENFNYRVGSGGRDGLETVPGLSSQFKVNPATGALTEIPFADGDLGSDKAVDIAAALLNRPEIYVAGGYQYQGSQGQYLYGMLDRVSVDWDGSNGLTESVDFSSERQTGTDGWGRPVLEPPRNFERRLANDRLLPGERELRQQARELTWQSKMLAANPSARRSLSDALRHTLGYDAPPEVVLLTNASGQANGSGAIQAGCPLWREGNTDRDAAKRVLRPEVAPTRPVFAGVAVQSSAHVNGPIQVTRTGTGNTILATVKARATEIPANTLVGYSAGNPWLVPLERDTPEIPAVGRTQLTIAATGVSNATSTIPVRLAAGGGNGEGDALSGVQMGIVQSWTADTDYVAVLLPGGDVVAVALPPPLRVGKKPTSTVEGFIYAIEPPYVNGDRLQVAGIADTGVMVGDQECVHCDVTPGRAWAVSLPVCISNVTYHVKVHAGGLGA